VNSAEAMIWEATPEGEPELLRMMREG